MKLEDIAKLLSEKINQEHYIKHYLELVYKKGFKEGVSKSKEPDFYCGISRSGCNSQCSECKED